MDKQNAYSLRSQILFEQIVHDRMTHQMKIAVAETGWGQARPLDIGVLLENAASHINQHLRSPFAGSIIILPSPPDQPYPMTLHRHLPQAPFEIQLSIRDRRWSQFAFQFAHEFCHVLSGYERLRDNPNNWFHEALCELASVFTLRQMAETWPTHPPFPNWSDYARSLADYAAQRLSHEKSQLPLGETLKGWLYAREDKLRVDPYQRQLNAVVAYSLLPLFEANPTGWNAIRSLPISDLRLHSYLREWASCVPLQDRGFTESILDVFSE